METLIINIPNKKSALVKQILKGLGVTIQQPGSLKVSDYKKKIAKVSTWTEEELSAFDENSQAFNSLKPQQW